MNVNKRIRLRLAIENKEEPVAWLEFLHVEIPVKDLRKLVYEKLNIFDRAMVYVAHKTPGVGLYPMIYARASFQAHCVKNGYISLLEQIEPQLLHVHLLWSSVARDNQLRVGQWLSALGHAPAPREHLSEFGHLPSAEGCLCFACNKLCITASARGHLSVLQWAKMQFPMLMRARAGMCAAAAKGGHTHVLQWLTEATR